MFCSLMSFCLSRFGVEVTTDRTSCPLFGTTHTKKTRSSSSLVTNLKAKRNSKYKSCARTPAVVTTVNFLKWVPPLILSNVDMLKLLHSGLQDLTGIIGKVQVSDLRQGNRYNGKSLFVLLSVTGANLMYKIIK